MNRAARRRAERQARKGNTSYPHVPARCPWCDSTRGFIAEICTEGCCPTRHSCASCGVPVGA